MKPLPITVGAEGGIVISAEKAQSLGIQAGSQLLLVPLENGRYLLAPIENRPVISREELSNILQTSFQNAGYTTEESVLQLIREVKREMAQEW